MEHFGIWVAINSLKLSEVCSDRPQATIELASWSRLFAKSWQSEGMTLRLLRSPVAPNIIITHGAGITSIENVLCINFSILMPVIISVFAGFFKKFVLVREYQ